MKYRKTAVLTAILLGISLFAAGCGGEGGKAGDSGAANTVETENSDGESAKEVSVQDIYKSVGESTELPSMVEGEIGRASGRERV